MPKEDHLLLVLDTSFNLWDLWLDILADNSVFEIVIVTDEFLKLLDPQQTRDLLGGVAGLANLTTVQIDFPDKDQDIPCIIDAVVWMVKRAKKLTALRLNNIDMVENSPEFIEVCSNHPNLKDIKVVGGEEGLKASYRSQRSQLSQLTSEGEQEQQQDQGADYQPMARRGSLTIRHERAVRHRRALVDSALNAQGGKAPKRPTTRTSMNAEDFAIIKRKLKKAISKAKKSDDEEEHRSRNRRQSRYAEHRQHHKGIQRRISRSESPRRRRHKVNTSRHRRSTRASFSLSPKRRHDRSSYHDRSSHHHHHDDYSSSGYSSRCSSNSRSRHSSHSPRGSPTRSNHGRSHHQHNLTSHSRGSISPTPGSRGSVHARTDRHRSLSPVIEQLPPRETQRDSVSRQRRRSITLEADTDLIPKEINF